MNLKNCILQTNLCKELNYYPTGSKKIEKDRNWGIEKDRIFLSLPTHHFASSKLFFYLYTYPELPGISIFFLFLCLVIFIFSYPSVYMPTEVASIFFYPLVYLFHMNLNLFLSFSVFFMTKHFYLSQTKNSCG